MQRIRDTRRATGAEVVAALATALLICVASAAHARVPVVMGDSWRGPSNRLQRIIDATYGPDRINAATDYIGARVADPDPMMWLSSVGPILQVREISGYEHRGDLGWYLEPLNGSPPVIDGVGDGPVFLNPDVVPATTVVHFDTRGLTVGFFLRSPDAGSGQGPKIFFSNRRFNDAGPDGAGALHDPAEGGDVQALIFDVSRYTRIRSWLVCFESRDSGALPGPCCEGTDNDYADYVFEVRALGATPALPASFGSLKVLYR